MLEINKELLELSTIAYVARALVDYSVSLEPDCRIEKASARYVLRPKNFVTFEPHFKLVKNLTVTLRGRPEEFDQLPELLLKNSLQGYSSFTLVSCNQLAAAASYIQRAHVLFGRGRGRPGLKPKTIEE